MKGREKLSGHLEKTKVKFAIVYNLQISVLYGSLKAFQFKCLFVVLPRNPARLFRNFFDCSTQINGENNFFSLPKSIRICIVSLSFISHRPCRSTCYFPRQFDAISLNLFHGARRLSFFSRMGQQVPLDFPATFQIRNLFIATILSLLKSRSCYVSRFI